MAVTEENHLYPSENLILKQSRRHFRTSVTPLHWQLRSLIGTGANGVVYFPTGTGSLHLQKLDTNTLETETVGILSFSPRCLVAKNGWVCCGGETGEFVAMKLEPSRGGPDRGLFASPGFDLDVNARLPLDSASRPDDSLLSLLRRSRNGSVPTSKKFGRERVNCITLWFPPPRSEADPNAYLMSVAVLANNDKHVTFVELSSLDALDEIEYPDCVNRAVLSPDGRMLVAIGDDPYLYVHERKPKSEVLGRNLGPAGHGRFLWKEVRRVHLKSQRKEDKSDQRGSFAACFSNTGTYLAVGTQYGVISVFSTAALLNPSQDPLVAFFPSSRPTSPDHRPTRDVHTAAPGAVREMAFSPGPYDLLAWSEDRGRVGVADLRSGFVSRQILYLDDDDAFQHLDLTDRSAIDPRLLGTTADRSDTLASSFANTLDLTSEARRGLNRRLLDGYHYPLTGEETQVLEAVQDHRRRREQRAAAARELLSNSRNQLSSLSRSGARTTGVTGVTASPPVAGSTVAATAVPRPRDRAGERSVDGTRIDWIRNSRDQIEQLIENLASGSQASRAADPARARDEARREAGMAGYRHLYRELLDRFVRETDDEPPPSFGSTPPGSGGFRSAAMRAAVRAAAAGEGAGAGSGSTLEGAGNGGGGSGSGIGINDVAGPQQQSLMPGLGTRHLSDYDWDEPGPSYGMSAAGGEDGPSTAAPPRRSGRSPMIWESLLSQVALRDPRDLGLRSGEVPAPDETAGLAWSEDGSVLYVGAENGIYEFRVNITSRKLLPSITLR